jgi:iron complex transport system permease protein
MFNSRVMAWKGLAALTALAGAVFLASLLLGSSGIGAGRMAAALFGDSSDDAARTVMTAVRLPRVLAAFVYFLARAGGTPRLLLTGVVLASACGAVISVLLAVADSTRVRGMVFWLAGGLEWALSPWTSALAAVGAVIVATLIGRPLNVLAAGELRARSVGLELEVWRSLLFFTCALLTAIAVVSAGTIGFVGLITPHAVRLTFRTSDHRVVAPASAMLGGTLLAIADLVARTIASPRQLPVGAIMALVGAPLFMVLLWGRQR